MVDQPYESQWQWLRKQYKITWLIMLTYIPGVASIGFPLAAAFGSDIPFFTVWGFWAIAFVINGNMINMFKCPRCGKPFFHTWWSHNPLARKCVHCKLPKWALADPNTISSYQP